MITLNKTFLTNKSSLIILASAALTPILHLTNLLKQASIPLTLILSATIIEALLSKKENLKTNIKQALIAFSLILLLLFLSFSSSKAAVFTEYNLPSGSSPINLALDNRSYVWFTNYGSDKIGRLIPGTVGSYEIREFDLPSGSKPWGIACENSSKRRIWFTEYSRDRIGVIIDWVSDFPLEEGQKKYNLTEFSLSSGAGPRGIALELNYNKTSPNPPKGTNTARIWFTEFNKGAIGTIHLNYSTLSDRPSSLVMEWFLPDSNSQPLSIIYVNGKVWFTEYQGDRIGCLELIDEKQNKTLIKEWPLISGSRPWGISNDTYGNIWVSLSGRNRIAKLNPYTNEITEYLIPTPNAGPRDIIVDRYNNVWFTEHDGNKIGRLTPGSNIIVEFARTGGAPTGITYGRVGSEKDMIWFTDEAGDRIGRIDPTKAITITTVTSILRAATSSSTATTIGSSTATLTKATINMTTWGFKLDENLTSTIMTTTSYTVSETSSVLKTSQAVTSITYATYSATTTATSTSYYSTVTVTTSVTYTVLTTKTLIYSTTVTTVYPSYIATITTTQTVTQTITSTTTVATFPFEVKPLTQGLDSTSSFIASFSLGILALTSISLSKIDKKPRKALIKKALVLAGVAAMITLLTINSSKAALITEWKLPESSTLPYEITFDDQSPYRVWFTENGGDKIGRLNHVTGEIFEIELPRGSRPWGIAFEKARKEIWFTMAGAHAIGIIKDYGGSVQKIPVFDGAYGEGPRGITIQEYVNGTDYPYIWFTIYGANRIGRIDPYYSGKITYWELDDKSGPQSIIFTSETGVWFTAYEGKYIGNLNPATGEVKKWSVKSKPWDLTIDSYGNIWFTIPDDDKIGKLNPYSGELTLYVVPTSGSKPYGITVDSQGYVWFTEYGQNRIGRFSPDDLTFTEFARSASGAPWGLAISPDNKIWFTDYAVNKICRLDPSMVLATTTVTSISTASKTTTTITPAVVTQASATATTILNDVATTLTTGAASTTTTYGFTETVKVLQTSSTSTVINYTTETIIVLGTSTSYSPTTVATTTQTSTETLWVTSTITSFTPATKINTVTKTTNVTVITTAVTTVGFMIPGYPIESIAAGLLLSIAFLITFKVAIKRKHFKLH
jgi:streptogramin lyase